MMPGASRTAGAAPDARGGVSQHNTVGFHRNGSRVVMDGQTPRKSWKRRLARALALCLLLAVAAVGALPWLLGTPPARSALAAAVNRVLAPSRVAVRGVSASWLGPIKLTGLTLRNARGKTL